MGEDGNENDTEVCPVCLEEIVVKDKISQKHDLLCGHFTCVACWELFEDTSNKCPLCRKDVQETEVAVKETLEKLKMYLKKVEIIANKYTTLCGERQAEKEHELCSPVRDQVDLTVAKLMDAHLLSVTNNHFQNPVEDTIQIPFTITWTQFANGSPQQQQESQPQPQPQPPNLASSQNVPNEPNIPNGPTEPNVTLSPQFTENPFSGYTYLERFLMDTIPLGPNLFPFGGAPSLQNLQNLHFQNLQNGQNGLNRNDTVNTRDTEDTENTEQHYDSDDSSTIYEEVD